MGSRSEAPFRRCRRGSGRQQPKRLTHLAIRGQGIRDDFKASVAGVAAYGASDLLCYRGPPRGALAVRQQEIWQPLLDWMARRHGVTLAVTHDVAPMDQDRVQLGRLTGVLAQFDAYELAALADATSVCGSVIVALALAAGNISEAEAWQVSTLDETFQAETWGQDEQAVVGVADKRQGLAAAQRFLRLVQNRD